MRPGRRGALIGTPIPARSGAPRRKDDVRHPRSHAAAAEAWNLFHRFLGPVADSLDPRATVVLSDALREYISPGPFGPSGPFVLCVDGVGSAQMAAAEQWPCPRAMECVINDTIRLCDASGLRHGEGVNQAAIAFRVYTDLLLDRGRLINYSLLRGLDHAAVHEAKNWNTSMPLVIKRIDAVVAQIKGQGARRPASRPRPKAVVTDVSRRTPRHRPAAAV